ncbi:MAG: hypothetical protein NW200_00465 [Hyphomonadaceae bacterium]|nr:hypothetical protein [Hyphomonadaceae bacterium]
MERQQHALKIIESCLAAFRVWMVGFVLDVADLLGDGAAARAWRGWIRAELNAARADLKAVLLVAAVVAHGVPTPGARRTRLHAPPRGFARTRCRASFRVLTRQLQWRSRSARGRLAQLWRWLADPGRVAAAIARRIARGLKRLAVVARRPPAIALRGVAAPVTAAADTS